jgi:hypothetical protein
MRRRHTSPTCTSTRKENAELAMERDVLKRSVPAAARPSRHPTAEGL